MEPSRGRETKSQRATLLPALEWPTNVSGQAVTATQAEVTRAGALTRFSLLLSARVPYHVSYLANPYRVVIDMPDVDFQLPVAAGRQGQGLVRAYRYGLFAPGKARVVIDTTLPVRVQKQAMGAELAGGGARLALDLVRTDEDTFLASIAPPPATPPRAAGGRRPPLSAGDRRQARHRHRSGPRRPRPRRVGPRLLREGRGACGCPCGPHRAGGVRSLRRAR